MAESGKYYNEYLNSRHFNVLLKSDAGEFTRAAEALCAELEYSSYTAVKNCKVLLCNLVIIHSRSLGKYMSISLASGSYAKDRYNPNCVGYRPIKELINLLVDHKYIEYRKRYKNLKYKTGYYSRLRPTAKLVELFGKYGLKTEMVVASEHEELLVLKGDTEKVSVCQKGNDGKTRSRMVNLAKLEDYRNKDYLDRKRAAIRRYNDLLSKSYIDIDEDGYQVKASRKEDIVIDLASKNVRRIFNNKCFEQGGRFYGGWWQSIPSDLRKRIIINGHNVVEIDYSGMHIHIMYAMKGLKLTKEPYVVSKRNDPESLRPVYKRIMLVAINCDNDDKCVEVVRKHIKSNPEDFADSVVNKANESYIRNLLSDLKKYHTDIAEYINTGIGLHAQYIDSEIASEVINVFTNKNIPILCIHDSFICDYMHEKLLFNEMIKAYIKVVNKELIAKRKLGLSLSEQDVKTDIDTLVYKVSNTWFSAHAMRTISTNAKQGYVIPAYADIKNRDIVPIAKPYVRYADDKYVKSLYENNAIGVSSTQTQRYMNYRAEGKQTFSAYIVIKKQPITSDKDNTE